MNDIKNIQLINQLMEDGKKSVVGAFVYYNDREPEFIKADSITDISSIQSVINSRLETLANENGIKVQKGYAKELKDKGIMKLYNVDDEKLMTVLSQQYMDECERYGRLDEAEEEIEEAKKSGIAKKIVGGVLLAAAVGGAALGLKACKDKEEVVPVVQETTIDDEVQELAFDSYEDYKNNAPETYQKEVATKVHDFAFNINSSAPWMTTTNENGETAKWGVTEEETLAFYVYQNNLTDEQAITLFGRKDIKQDDIVQARNSFVTKMIYFYCYDQTGMSNVANLFENEKDKAAVLKFEQLNASYNKAELTQKSDIAINIKDELFNTYYDNSQPAYVGFSEDMTSGGYILSSVLVSQTIMNSTSEKVTNAYNKVVIENDAETGKDVRLIDALHNEIDTHCNTMYSRLEEYSNVQDKYIERDDELADNFNQKEDMYSYIDAAMTDGAKVETPAEEKSDLDILTENTMDIDTVMGYIKADLIANNKYPEGEFDKFPMLDFSTKTNTNSGSKTKTVTTKTSNTGKITPITTTPLTESEMRKLVGDGPVDDANKKIDQQNEQAKQEAEKKAVDRAAIYQAVENGTYNFYKQYGNTSGEYNYQQHLNGVTESDIINTAAGIFSDAKNRGIYAYNVVHSQVITDPTIPGNVVTPPPTSTDPYIGLPGTPTITPVNPVPGDDGIIGGGITPAVPTIPSHEDDPYYDAQSPVEQSIQQPTEEQSVGQQIEQIITEEEALAEANGVSLTK